MLRRKINPFIFERTDNIRDDYVDKDGTSVYKSSAFLERPSGTAPVALWSCELLLCQRMYLKVFK